MCRGFKKSLDRMCGSQESSKGSAVEPQRHRKAAWGRAPMQKMGPFVLGGSEASPHTLVSCRSQAPYGNAQEVALDRCACSGQGLAFQCWCKGADVADDASEKSCASGWVGGVCHGSHTQWHRGSTSEAAGCAGPSSTCLPGMHQLVASPGHNSVRSPQPGQTAAGSAIWDPAHSLNSLAELHALARGWASDCPEPSPGARAP